MPSAPKLDLSIAISQIFGTLLQKQATRLQIKLGGGQTEEVLKNCVYSDQESLLQCVPEKLTAIDVPWNIKSYNTRLIVHTNVFPVHGLILSRESLIFRAVISKTVIPDGNIETIRLKNYDTDDVMELLNFLYMKEIQIDGKLRKVTFNFITLFRFYRKLGNRAFRKLVIMLRHLLIVSFLTLYYKFSACTSGMAQPVLQVCFSLYCTTSVFTLGVSQLVLHIFCLFSGVPQPVLHTLSLYCTYFTQGDWGP